MRRPRLSPLTSSIAQIGFVVALSGAASAYVDDDNDLVQDADDNCTSVSNDGQLDTNQDGFGNACDADYTNDGVVGGPDYFILSVAYGAMPGDPEYDPMSTAPRTASAVPSSVC